MNKTKLARRTALAAKIRDRYNPSPAYRIINVDTSEVLYTAETREDARATRRAIHSVPTA